MKHPKKTVKRYSSNKNLHLLNHVTCLVEKHIVEVVKAIQNVLNYPEDFFNTVIQKFHWIKNLAIKE